MNATETCSGTYQLCFRSPVQSGSAFSFPCDQLGRVQLDGLSDRARNNYLYARAMVGRELLAPAVVATPATAK